MKFYLRNEDDQEFIYEWNESLIVNISTESTEGELVNFDVFTFAEPLDTAAQVLEACQRHQKYAESADFRYSDGLLPKRVLLYGA